VALASGYARGIKVCGKKNVCTAFHDKKKKYPIERKVVEISSAPTAPRNKPNVRTVPPTVSPYCHAIYLQNKQYDPGFKANSQSPTQPVLFPKTNTERPSQKRNRRPTRKSRMTARRTLFQTFPHIPSIFPTHYLHLSTAVIDVARLILPLVLPLPKEKAVS